MGKIRRERQKFHISAVEDDVGMEDKPVPPAVPAPKLKKVNLELFDVSENIFAGIDIKLDSVNKLPEPSVEVSKTPVKSAKPTFSKKEKSVVSKEPTRVSERQLTKKEKLKLKHEKLLQKIEVVQQGKQRVKDKRSKKTTKEPSLAEDVTSLVTSIQGKKTAAKAISPRVNKVPIGLPGIVYPSGNAIDGSKKKFSSNMKTIEEALLSLNDSLPSLDSVLKLRSKNANTGLSQDDVDGPKKKGKKSVDTKVAGSSKNISRPNKSKELVKQYNHYQKLLSDETYKSNPRAVIALHIKNKLRDRK